MARTQAADYESQRAAILENAAEAFAEAGYAACSMTDIARKSGASKARLYHYYESKEGLYQAVMQRIGSELDIAFEQLASEVLPIEEAIKASIRAGITYGAMYPHRGMLWFHEAIQNKGTYGQSSGWQKSFWSMAAILEQGMAEGVLRSIDPFLTAVNILGVCTFYFNAHENLKYLDPTRQLLSIEAIDQQANAAIDFVWAGIKA